jgi:hypothetical protein
MSVKGKGSQRGYFRFEIADLRLDWLETDYMISLSPP